MAKTVDQGTVVIEPARITRIKVKIKGLSPYVQNKFSKKARDKMMREMSKPKNEGKTKKAGREPRNFDDDFAQAQHIATAGWYGIPAPSFRCAMIDACRTTGLPMTKAKMGVFVQADGFDKDDGTPLIKLQGGKPEKLESLVRNDNGSADIRIRPMWREWSATLNLEFDEDMISASSVVNLLDRAGRQVGIGEGRSFSKDSTGMGWGMFQVEQQKE